MTIVELLLVLLVAAVCGALGQALAGYSRGGCLAAIVLGFVGAMLGSWLARQLELPEPFVVQVGEVQFPLLWTVIGSALFVALLSFLTSSARERQ